MALNPKQGFLCWNGLPDGLFFVFCSVSWFMLFLLVHHVLYREASGLFDRALWLAIGGDASRALREEVGILVLV